MLGGVAWGLVVALILSLFGFNDFAITAVQPFVPNVELVDAHYYVAFALIGLVGGAFH